MHLRIGLLFALLGILTPLGCSNNSTEPETPLPEPPLTYTGSGLFGFSVDGTVIASNNGDLKGTLAVATYTPGNSVARNNCAVDLSWAST